MLPPKVRAVFVKELRDALRDRRTLFASVIVPILLYPIMLLGMAELAQHARAKLDREIYEVAITPGTKDFFDRLTVLAADEAEAPQPIVPLPVQKPAGGLNPRPGMKDTGGIPSLRFLEIDPLKASEKLNSGEVRAIVKLPVDFEARVKARDNVSFTVDFDRAEHRSQDAVSRLQAMFKRYESSIIKERLESEKLQAEFLRPFRFEANNVAEATKVGGSLIGIMLPLIFIMMIITGAIYPAIDMTAGEKERSTLETLIGAPVRPYEVIMGKFLAVATLSLGNAALNVGSFAGTFSLMPMPAQGGFQFPWQALPATLLLLAPLTLLFSGLLLAVSSFAANHKEAQIYCLPIYLVPVLGMMVIIMPGIELEGPLLLAPVVNTALLIKELFLGHGTTRQMAFVFISTCLYAAGTVAIAARIFAREEVLFSAQGSFRLFLNRKFFKKASLPRPGDSLLLAALLFPLNFYFQSALAKMLVDLDKGIQPMQFAALVALPQYLVFLALPVAVAWYLKLDLKKTFMWTRPSLRAVLGAVLLGCGSWLIAQQIVSWQSQFWSPAGGDLEVLEKSLNNLANMPGGMVLLVFLIGFTPGLCEEHLFRGFLQQGLVKSGKWLAIIAVGAIFAAYHFPLFKQPVVMLMGCAIAYVAFETQSIWPGVLYHFLHNSLSVVGPQVLGMTPEPRKAGEAYPGVPLQYLLPAVILFAIGLTLVRRARRSPEAPAANTPALTAAL